MAIEPTTQERQQRGFEFLRDEARAAHTEGDGLRVAHLCETALQEVGRLVNRNQLLVPLPELVWAFSFQLFWLTSQTSVLLSRDTLNKIPRRNELDERVF